MAAGGRSAAREGAALETIPVVRKHHVLVRLSHWLNVPVGQISTATFVPGTPGHSWQSAACAGSSIGRKGMIVAAKTLALTGADLFLDPKLLEAARHDFDSRRAGHEYRSRIPANQGPPLHYRDYAVAGESQ